MRSNINQLDVAVGTEKKRPESTRTEKKVEEEEWKNGTSTEFFVIRKK
jgi:hypothetical protein